MYFVHLQMMNCAYDWERLFHSPRDARWVYVDLYLEVRADLGRVIIHLEMSEGGIGFYILRAEHE